MQNCGMAPHTFVTWAEGLSTEAVGEDFFLAKNRTKFEWKPFFFGLHLILGRKTGLVLGWKIFILVFINLKFSEFPAPPPPFENPAYATGRSPSSFGPKTNWFCGEDLHILLDRIPTHFAAKTFIFVDLHVSLNREREPPRNPAPGATILSNATVCDILSCSYTNRTFVEVVWSTRIPFVGAKVNDNGVLM